MLGRVICFGGAVLLLGAIYLEFVADIRTPRSALQMQGALVTHNKLAPDAIAAATTALKAKFGPATEVSLGFMTINAKLNGEVVGTAQANSVFHEALGMTQIAGEDGKISIFPFHISPYEIRDSIHPTLVPMLKMRLGLAFERSVDFDRYDFSIDRCRQFSANELGLSTADRLLHLGRSTVCTVAWKRAPARSMLLGIVVADGGAWIRPFARSACRMLSKAWVASTGRAERQSHYVQCLLVDRPENKPFGSGVSTVAYEVRKDGSLARFEQRPAVIQEQMLRPSAQIPRFERVQSAIPGMLNEQ